MAENVENGLWHKKMQNDAANMSAYDFAYTHGKINLKTWDIVNNNITVDDVEDNELETVLGQLRQFLDLCTDGSSDDQDEEEQRVQDWIEYTKTRLDNLLSKFPSYK